MEVGVLLPLVVAVETGAFLSLVVAVGMEEMEAVTEALVVAVIMLFLQVCNYLNSQQYLNLVKNSNCCQLTSQSLNYCHICIHFNSHLFNLRGVDLKGKDDPPAPTTPPQG